MPGDHTKYLEKAAAHLILVDSCSWRMEMPFCLLLGFSFMDLTGPRNLLWVTSDWNIVRPAKEILMMTELEDSPRDPALYINTVISCDLYHRSQGQSGTG